MKKILVIKHGSLGDITLALTAFASIRNHFNKSEIILLTERKFFNFFIRSGYVDRCLEDNRKESLIKQIKKKIPIFKEKFDLIIDLQNSKRTSFYNFIFRIFQSAKICSSRPFSHFRYHIPIQGQESVSEGLFNQLILIGVKKINNVNFGWLEEKIDQSFSKPIALFIPGVSKKGNYKQWQPTKFAYVAKYLENLNYMICVVGNKQDEDSINPIVISCKNLINKTEKSPPEIIYSLALKSKIIFSNDTGPGHIASLAKKNFVWIVNDNKISRSNMPLGKHIYKIQAKSVKNITSEEVIDFIKKENLL